MSNENEKIDQMIDEFDETKEKHKRMLQYLLDEATSAKNKYLAVSSRMGNSRSYLSSVPLEWFANVNFASDLDIFDEYSDENNKSIKINPETLNMLSQRKPDWSRQLVMTVYLAIRDHHKFPPALLVGYQDWILDANDDRWGADGRALEDSVLRESLDSKNWVVNLNQDNTKFYALDGQHRLMAIRGLRDLIQGNLSKKNKDGKSGKAITFEEILEYHAREDEYKKEELKKKMSSMMQDEQIGVEIIPAVQRGETREEAFMRLRQIFVDVNQNAKRLEKGELALLDETDGFRIVARNVMISHDLFRDGNAIRVDVKASQLSETSDEYTTLQTIVKIAKQYLGQQMEFNHWENEICGITGAGLLRPEDKELESGKKKLESYFDALMTLPSHKSMMQGTKAGTLRRRSIDDEGHDHVLFRPIAQEALAEAIGCLEIEQQRSPKDVCKTLAKKDDTSSLKLTDPASPFFGVLCDPIELNMRRQSRYRDLAAQMFIYLLGGGTPNQEDREDLKRQVFKSRQITLEGIEPAKAIGLDGQEAVFEQFDLPNPW